jgi:hypothetical protein
MDFRRMFDPQGLNWWTIVSGIGMNFILTGLLFLGTSSLAASGTGETLYALVMAAGGFLIPLFTAYVCGRLGDERYLTYAFYPMIGYLILTVPGILIAGLFGVLMVAIGILGAFNGAQLAARRAMKRRREIMQGLDSATSEDTDARE